METLTGLLIQVAFMFIPVVGLIAYVHFISLRKQLNKERAPMSDKMLRSPGESLRRKLSDLEDATLNWVLAMVVTATVTGFFAGQFYRQTKHVVPAATHPLVLVLLVITMAFMWKLIVLTNTARDYRLGLSGELAVGEELNKLMLSGCRVYHDFPGGDDWNIDHIIVSEMGVFAVETKARRKRKASPGKEDHKVDFTGDALEFSSWREDKPLLQAERNARSLAGFLTKATGEKCDVAAMVVLPGWFVSLQVNSPTKVLNPKQVRSAVLGGKTVLKEAQIQRISHQIEQKCRDVEF